MKIIIHGLGRMGMQIARKLSEEGHFVIAHNRSPEPIQEAVGYGAVAAHTKEEAIAAFNGEPVVVWIMLPADVVDQQLNEWLSLVPQGSTIIDGGNTHFTATLQHNQTVKNAGSDLIDVGTSGGVWGYDNGFSMMVGGDNADKVSAIDPILTTLAKPSGGYHYFGASGSGDYVKMVHNAIEYGMMESLAEGYHILQAGPYQNLDLAAAGDVWQQHSVVTSWLNELARDALRDNPTMEGIDGYVAETGEARWTLDIARERQVPMPAIQAAFDVRLASQHGTVSFATKLLAMMRNKFGGHQVNK